MVLYEPIPELANKKIRLSFLDRTLRAMTALFEGFLVAEEHVRKKGLLQGLDPRVKLLSILLWIVTASLLHSLPLLFGLYGFTVVLAVLSRIGVGLFIKRIWLVLPLFAGIIALPATLNLFTPGETVVHLFTLGREVRFGPVAIPAEIGMTRQGVAAALFLIGRVATSTSFVLLLTLTTSWADLLKALRSVRVPQIYVQTLGMTLRYLLLLCQVVREMHTARKSRTIRPRRANAEQRWVAEQVGTLFGRSMRLSTEVHRAMVARGYQGEVRILRVFRLRKRDLLWMVFCAGSAAFLIYTGA